jgi:hypothetical protein
MSKAFGKLGSRMMGVMGVNAPKGESRSASVEDSLVLNGEPSAGTGLSDRAEQLGVKEVGVEDVSVCVEGEGDADADADAAYEREEAITRDVPSTSLLFSPPMVAEEEGFLLPEDQLSVDFFNRANPPLDFAYTPSPLFLSTAYDEFSRAYCTINVGAELPSVVELVRYGEAAPSTTAATAAIVATAVSATSSALTATACTAGAGSAGTAGSLGTALSEESAAEEEECGGAVSVRGASAPPPSASLLKHYCPSLTEWYSSHKSSPDDTLHLLSGSVCTDRNVLFKVFRCTTKQSAFEPIFGSLTLYAMVDEELVRLSESAHFDATPQTTRRLYGSCYIDSQGNEVGMGLVPDGVPGSPNRALDFTGCCVNVADASGERKHLHMFNIPVPQELRDRELFLVVQVR